MHRSDTLRGDRVRFRSRKHRLGWPTRNTKQWLPSTSGSLTHRYRMVNSPAGRHLPQGLQTFCVEAKRRKWVARGACDVENWQRVSERMCKEVSVSLPLRGDSHDDDIDDYA